jgi:hypothetical protein
MRKLAAGLILAFALMSVAADEPAGDQRSLANGLIHYTPPPGSDWSTPETKPDATSAVYTAHDRLGQLAIILEPKDMREVSENIGIAIIKELRARRVKSGAKVLLPATIEKDPHFPLRIHEKYMVKDRTNDSVQLFRNVGPRVVVVISESLSDDANAVAQVHKTGEDALSSVKFNRQASDK